MPMKSNNLFVWRQGNRKFIIAIFGFCLSIFGILCGMFWEQIFNHIMEKEMILRPDSRVYDNWKNPPLWLHLDIYLFNWTNPEDFSNASTKPILQQLGPYRFTDVPDKIDIQWHAENNSVSYRRKSDFFFDAVGSNGNLNDMISTLNAVALSAAGKGKNWNNIRRNMIDVGLKVYGQEISVQKTVDEMLFTGYTDDLIDVARAMPLFDGEVEVPFDRFGWFYTRNGSADLTGTFNVYTGADDISKIGQMHSWNYKTNTGFFDSYCGMTNGSAGEFYPPDLKPHGSVSMFTPDMCRTVPLDYEETVEVEGINGYKYVGGARAVDNGTLYPENACFCGGQCVPSGVMNISSCRFGSPVFMSFPHFYNADEFYLKQVEGMKPDKAAHEFYMILDPKTGIALEVAARFQVNMLVEPIESISLYENIPTVFMPLIWFEQKVRITPELAEELKMIPKILLAGQIFAGICFAIGLILMCLWPIDQFCSRHKHSEDLKTANKLENGKHITAEYKAKSTKQDLMPDKQEPDSSPLLEQPKFKPHIKLLPKQETIDSIATKSSIYSEE